MSNIYWPVYKNLEREFYELMYNIHIDDSQLKVYSIKITELILRAAVEIESISKELYLLNGGPEKSNIKYDEDAIKLLNKLWKLDQKEILISTSSCHLTKKVISPFKKNEVRTGSSRMTFSWNNSYQNIKHDRSNSLKFGSIKYLFDIMAALFILNIYLKDETIELNSDSDSINFPIGLGSTIFSIGLHKWFGYDEYGEYMKRDEFEKCIYITKMTDKSKKLMDDENIRIFEKRLELCLNHPKYKNWAIENKIEKYTGKPIMVEILGRDEYSKIFKQSYANRTNVFSLYKWEGITNKNSI